MYMLKIKNHITDNSANRCEYTCMHYVQQIHVYTVTTAKKNFSLLACIHTHVAIDMNNMLYCCAKSLEYKNFILSIYLT